MEIFPINSRSIPTVSNLMAGIKPDWWDEAGASQQLGQGVGWYCGEAGQKPEGWILCKAYEEYKTGEIECLGYDDHGCFKIGKELQPLVEKAEDWARGQGFVIMRFTIGSSGLSCHGRDLNRPWEELRDLRAVDREEYEWFLSMGYVPSGVLPNIYGDNYHGILLVKNLTAGE